MNAGGIGNVSQGQARCVFVYIPGFSWGTCAQSSVAFLSSSELDEVVLEENWYLRFTVTGMLQLSRYLKKRNMFDRTDYACVWHEPLFFIAMPALT